MNLSHDFSINHHFLDPILTNDGKPYGPWRYKKIVEECYIISHAINTSYTDLMKITPREREYFIEFLNREAEEMKKLKEDNSKKLNKTLEEVKSAKQSRVRM